MPDSSLSRGADNSRSGSSVPMGPPHAWLPGTQGGSSSIQRQRHLPPLIALYLYTIWVTHFGVLGDRVIEGAGDIGPGNAPASYKQSTALAGISARDQPAGLTIPASTHKVNTSSPTSYQGTLPAIRATGAATRAGQLYLKPVNLAQSTKLQAPVNPFDQPASAHRSTHLTGRPLRAGQLRLPARL